MKITYTMPIVQLNDEHNDKGKIMTMNIITMTMKKNQIFQTLKIIR